MASTPRLPTTAAKLATPSPPTQRGEQVPDAREAKLRHKRDAAKRALEAAQARVLSTDGDLSAQLDLVLDVVRLPCCLPLR